MQRIIYRGASYRRVTAAEMRIAQDADARVHVQEVIQGLAEKLVAATNFVANVFVSLKNDLTEITNKAAKHEDFSAQWGTFAANVASLKPLAGNATVKALMDQTAQLANSAELKAIMTGGVPAQPAGKQPAAQESPFAGLGQQMDQAAQQAAQPAQQKA